MTRRAAKVTGEVPYTLADGSTARVPLGDCIVTIEHSVADLKWGDAPEESVSFALVDLDRCENAGAIHYTD